MKCRNYSGRSGTNIPFHCLLHFQRGADETSTGEITAALLEQSKTAISRKLSVAKGNIVVDCDAISLIISTPEQTMTNAKYDAMKDFLHVFGSDISGCSLPHQNAIGSSKASGLFGCGGNMCQHLPECLQGQEMLVLDTPIKVGVHKSCKKRMESELNSKGYYLSLSNCNNVCFDAQAAFNKPPYGIMVEAIINSCCIDGVYVIHVADVGSRYPITTEPKSQINKLFQTMQAMKAIGIAVELAQCDIAFVCSVPNDQLVQVSLDRKQPHHHKETDRDCRFPLLDGFSSTVFPIHSLPDFEGQKLSQRELKGTILLRRVDSRWRTGKEVLIASQDDEDSFSPDSFSEATDLYASLNANGPKTITVNSSNLFSMKVYSTIAHILLQKRHTYPLSLKSMYGIGNRSIAILQTLVKNIDNARREAFDKVRTYGIGVRIEVSIRPHPNDELRKKGHFNDILLLVALAICGFCQGQRFAVKISCADLRPTETKAMELVTQCMAMLKFRHQSQFNEVYTNLKVVEWLRSHLSILMITIGLSPQYGVKYINNWLHDYRRYDPYNVAGSNPNTQLYPAENTATARKRKMLRRLKPLLRGTLGLNTGDVETLIQFIDAYPSPKNCAKGCYKKLSFRTKLLLPTLLISEIIPFISTFMSGEGEKTPEAANEGKTPTGGRKRNRVAVNDGMVTTTETEGEDDDNWFLQQEYVIQRTRLLEDIAATPMPSDPLCLAIYGMFQISSFSDPGRPGFSTMLFCFIFICYKAKLTPKLKHSHNDDSMAQLAARIAFGNRMISTSVLRNFCASLGLCGAAANKSTNEYLRLLCYHFQFPCHGVHPKHKHHSDSEKRKQRNQVLNKVIEQDLVTVLQQTHEISRLYRNADDTVIDVFRQEKVALMGKRPNLMVKLSHRNLYCALAECFNTTENELRESLHRRMSSLQNLGGLFLGNNGVTDREFREAKNMEELQSLKAFQLLFTGKISEIVRSQSFPPGIILPIVCLVYAKDISFYNWQSNSTIMYTSCNLNPPRVIKYAFKGLEISPKLKNSIIISLAKSGEYECNVEIVHVSESEQQSQQSNFYNHHFFSLDPFGGRRSIRRNAKKFLPNQTVKRNQPFYLAMSSMLSRLDPNYVSKICEEGGEVDNDNDRDTSTLSRNDSLGIISFVEQLYSCARTFTGFGRSVKENCSTFNLALPSVLAFLKSVHLNDLSHDILCPIVSLRYKLSFGVLEIATNRKRLTHFYSFDPFKQQVEYKQFKEYTALVDHHEVMYLFSSSSQTGYYMPSTLYRNWIHDSTIKTNFSYLSNDNFDRVFKQIQSKYNLDLVPQHEMQPATFRPETDHNTVIIPTHIKCQRFGMSLPQMIQRGIKHHALIILFPCKGNRGWGEWDACVVHHPLQETHSAMATLQSFLCNAPTEGRYNTECIQGLCPENCEAGLYMMLYAYIAHKVRSLANFKVAMRKLDHEDDLSRKVRMWVHQVANEIEGEGGVTHEPLPPVWIEQLTDSRNS